MTEYSKAKRDMLNEVLCSITENFGNDVIVKIQEDRNKRKRSIPSANGELNELLGGGFKLGRIVELYGHEGVGKTTFALKLAASVQAEGGLAAFVDVEHTFSRTYAASLGIDERRLLVAEPYSAEEALTVCERLIRSGLFDIVILDSVAALSPELEAKGSVLGSDEWLQAEILSQAMRRISLLMRNSRTLFVCINQLRGRPITCHFEGETTPGGMILKFISDYRLKLTTKESEFVLAKAPNF